MDFNRQNHRLFDLEMEFLTLKMTLNHKNNARNGSHENEVLHLFLASFVEKSYLTLKYLAAIFLFLPLKKSCPKVPKWHPADSCSEHPLEPESTIKHRPYRETRSS